MDTYKNYQYIPFPAAEGGRERLYINVSEILLPDTVLQHNLVSKRIDNCKFWSIIKTMNFAGNFYE